MLAFKDTAELEQQGETVLYLVTEPVKPLAQVLQELDVDRAAKCAPPPWLALPAAVHA